MGAGLRVLGAVAMGFVAPWTLLMLWAAALRAPLGFALFGVFFVFCVFMSVRDANRAAAKPVERPREPRFPMEDARPPTVESYPLAFRPVRMRHWHEAVGPDVRRPVWTVPKRGA